MNVFDEYERVKNQGGYFVTDKVIFRITGDVASLVNGLATNVLEAPVTAFLDKQGKLIALADQVMISQNELYLAVPEMAAKLFYDHLHYYEVYSQAKLEKTALRAVHFFKSFPEKGIAIPQKAGLLYLIPEQQNFPELHPISEEGYTVLRLEAGIPLQGIDFIDPMFLETGVDEAVSYSKGCYLGQEIIARVHYKGKPKRRLVRILFDKIPEFITVNEQEVGKITSAHFSPQFQKHLAFAMVEKYDEAVDGGIIIR